MSNYSSPTTDIEVKVGICENPGPCWQCGRNIRKDERYVLIACYDKEADMHFGQGYCSIECLQEDFAEMMAEKDEEIIYPRLQPQEKGKKWVFITQNAYVGGIKFAAEIHEIPDSHAGDSNKAAWWFLNRISASACLEMKAIPIEQWLGVKEGVA